ncbi:MAG TPA: hypothetical protein VHY09_04905 [Candidatus Methylacidiphilales bacterium]|jgi:hypothetical protein|nr:hypothetical protein [Candidatus Methylacidiphilales bacterium]
MSGKRVDWAGWIGWLMDQFVFSKIPDAQSKTPFEQEKQAEDYATLREEARQADAKQKSEPPKPLDSTDKKALDKEFWETM